MQIQNNDVNTLFSKMREMGQAVGKDFCSAGVVIYSGTEADPQVHMGLKNVAKGADKGGGQYVNPNGKAEAEDKTWIDTAARELFEELRGKIEIARVKQGAESKGALAAYEKKIAQLMHASIAKHGVVKNGGDWERRAAVINAEYAKFQAKQEIDKGKLFGAFLNPSVVLSHKDIVENIGFEPNEELVQMKAFSAHKVADIATARINAFKAADRALKDAKDAIQVDVNNPILKDRIVEAEAELKRVGAVAHQYDDLTLYRQSAGTVREAMPSILSAIREANAERKQQEGIDPALAI